MTEYGRFPDRDPRDADERDAAAAMDDEKAREDRICRATMPKVPALIMCTRTKGHSGDHVSGFGLIVSARWPVIH
jgi:hypothetical protein